MQENINIPDSNITTNLTFRKLVLMNMQQLTNFPYIEKDFDALTDYELLSLVVKYLNDVIDNQNEQNDSITRMYNSFLALQEYVNNTKDTLEDAFNELDDYVRNYFANLDVQDEINNKLDEMYEDGQIDEIINRFFSKFSGEYKYADDYETLEDAIAAADSSYGILYLSPGKTYEMNESVEVNNNLSIIGNDAKIVSNIEDDYMIKYQNPVSPNNWDLFEKYSIRDLKIDCNNKSYGFLSIDKFHYGEISNIQVTQNIDYAFKIKTVYWSKFNDIHVQNCDGGLFNICGTFSQSLNLYLGSNQNLFTNCSIIDFNKSGNFYGISIKDRCNQNRFVQTTIQNSKSNNNELGIGLYMSNVTNNVFDSFYGESNRIHVYMEQDPNMNAFGNTSFYNPYLGTDVGVQCLAYIKDNVANFYNPTFYSNALTDGLNKTLFISHHSSGKLSFIHIELDMPYNIKTGNTLLAYYDGTTYTNYEGSNPNSGEFGTVFSKQPYNGNTFNIMHRTNVNPLYVDQVRVTTENDSLRVYRYGMFGNQNGTYGIQPTLAGNASQMPTSPINGLTYFLTNGFKLITYYNGNWYYADGTIYTP